MLLKIFLIFGFLSTNHIFKYICIYDNLILFLWKILLVLSVHQCCFIKYSSKLLFCCQVLFHMGSQIEIVFTYFARVFITTILWKLLHVQRWDQIPNQARTCISLEAIYYAFLLCDYPDLLHVVCNHTVSLQNKGAFELNVVSWHGALHFCSILL